MTVGITRWEHATSGRAVPGAREVPARPVGPTERRRARGPAVRPGGRRARVALPEARPRVAAGGCPSGVPAAVVLRRRRVAALVLGVVLAALVGLAVVLAAGSEAPDGPVPSATTVTVVGGGESLTTVARRTAPGADPDATVERIRELNGLSSSAVAVGRPLVVPAG